MAPQNGANSLKTTKKLKYGEARMLLQHTWQRSIVSYSR
jgi:hypothetical protein